ncbi:MAG TPA: hypothetical protein VF783_25340, partial [Terriglobales bacterium]
PLLIIDVECHPWGRRMLLRGILSLMLIVPTWAQTQAPTLNAEGLPVDSSVVVVTSCNFTAPIATLGALRKPEEVLVHPDFRH